jgi:transcriptional regulator with XRE-family HTH domain
MPVHDAESELSGRVFENLPATLYLIRTFKRMTQDEVAKRAGLTKPMISSFEKGRRRPSLQSFERHLKGLGVDLNLYCDIAKIVEEIKEVAYGSR